MEEQIVNLIATNEIIPRKSVSRLQNTFEKEKPEEKQIGENIINSTEVVKNNKFDEQPIGGIKSKIKEKAISFDDQPIGGSKIKFIARKK